MIIRFGPILDHSLSMSGSFCWWKKTFAYRLFKPYIRISLSNLKLISESIWEVRLTFVLIIRSISFMHTLFGLSRLYLLTNFIEILWGYINRRVPSDIKIWAGGGHYWVFYYLSQLTKFSHFTESTPSKYCWECEQVLFIWLETLRMVLQCLHVYLCKQSCGLHFFIKAYELKQKPNIAP